MNDTSTNSIFVALLFILRCFVPIAVLFGVSYLLRKMGLVAVEPPEPPDKRDENDESASASENEDARPETPEEDDANGEETIAESKEDSQ